MDEQRPQAAPAGATVWFTGLPGAGKSTVAAEVARLLGDQGVPSSVLDGDVVRRDLSADLGFSPEDRHENVRRVAAMARVLADSGVVALCALVSPYAEDRDRARALHAQAGLRFVEVWVATPAEVCADRDPKGLYAKARRGEISDFTGVNAPYEAPPAAEVVLDGAAVPVRDNAERVLAALRARD